MNICWGRLIEIEDEARPGVEPGTGLKIEGHLLCTSLIALRPAPVKSAVGGR